MQDLRNKLLKVGLVDKKRTQEAETQARRDRKQKGAAEQAEQEQARRQQFEARRAAEAEAQRLLEAERAEERLRHERQNRLRNIVDRWALRHPRAGQQPFYFVRRSGKIGRLLVNAEIAEQLSLGAVAIVEREGEPEGGDAARATAETHVLLPREAAERILELEEAAVRFWARREQPIGIGEGPDPEV